MSDPSERLDHAAPGRTVARRFEESAGYARVESAATIWHMATATVRYAVKPPFTWRDDAISECALALRRCLAPAMIAMFVLYLANVLVFSNLFNTLGAPDRVPGGLYLGSVREVSTWIAGMIPAGVAGAALTADIGARKIREELDAMQVLAIDHVRLLVVPRVLAMVGACVITGLGCHFVGVVTPVAVSVLHLHIPFSVAVDGVRQQILPLDLFAFMGKLAVLGFFFGVVGCAKGLSCGGGAEGVGRAVNQAVVIMFFGTWLFNSLYNTTLLSLFPDLSVLRG
ncbi:MAG: hypothetical protein JWO02_1866 [Solirubrobacterales bacterium]|nr:hypothetical protein [Solirubrobacterales bacterium]